MAVGAIVFDLDWTLYDADTFYDAAWRRVAAHVAGATGQPADVLTNLLVHVWKQQGPSCPDLFDRWTERAALPAQPWVQTAIDVLHGDWRVGLAPYPGVIALLRGLSDVSLGLLTEGRTATQRRKLDALGLDSFFDSIVVSEEIGTRKSTGKPYAEICRRLGVEPRQTLSVGDRFDSDVVPPAALGAMTCLVRQGPFAARPAPRGADWQIDHVAALRPIVRQWQVERAR